VFPKEPKKNSPLSSLKNVVVRLNQAEDPGAEWESAGEVAAVPVPFLGGN
jgi:hypothetical protein